MTFLRMVRYGVNNFSRNAWLTTAATAVMTVTLVVILTTVLSQLVFDDTIGDLRRKVDISIYLRNDTPAASVKVMQQKLEALPNTAAVRYISPAEAQSIYNDQNKTDANQLKELGDILRDTGPLIPSSFRVRVNDLNKLNDLKKLVSSDQTFQNSISPKLPPSYGGDRQAVIANIARTADFTEKAGLAASIVFVVISVMIIFNTIRMAIFNRREEIQMMKLIGADKSFIRGPFVVEACMYGFFAAVITVGLVYVGLLTSHDKIASYGVSVDRTVALMQNDTALVLLVTIVIGAVLGVISSQLAVRRYLKV